MFSLNTTKLKQDAQIRKNVLYGIEKDRTVSVREEHDDSPDVEIVNLMYSLKEGQYAIFGKDYRSPTVSKHGCKSTDVLTCLIDDKNKKIYSLILDIKKDISAFSDDLLKDSALLTAIKEVSEFIEQLHHAILHKESFLLYCKDEGYIETTEVGIATRSFEKKKFIEVAEFLEKIMDDEKPVNMQPLLWYKFKNNLMPYVGKARQMKDFANQKVVICGGQAYLHVYLLEWVRGTEYAVSIEVNLDDE